MDRGSKGRPATECKCGSAAGLERGMCVDCRREYGREYYRRKLAKNAAKGGPLIPREKRGFCLQKKKPLSYTAIVPSERRESGRALDPYVPVAPIKQRGDKIPAAWEPMAVKLQHPCWVEHYTRRGSIGWAMREAGL
jgi:hypothetical protein